MSDNTTFVAAATASPPVLESNSSRLAALEGPLDVLVPFTYHRSLRHLVRPICSVTIEYHSGTQLSELGFSSEPCPAGSAPRGAMTGVLLGTSEGGRSTVTYTPAVRPHRAEVEAAVSGVAFSDAASPPPPANTLSFGGGIGEESPERKNAKQGFLETLLNGGAAENGGMGGAQGKVTPLDQEVRTRLHDDVCDATRIEQAALLVRLVGMVAASRTHVGRTGVGCITTLDLSYTQLGSVGAGAPPTAFDAHGEPLQPGEVTAENGGGEEKMDEEKLDSGKEGYNDRGAGKGGDNAPLATAAVGDSAKPAPPSVTWTLPMRFFPDESEPRSATSAKTLADIAERSLSLCYVVPLLYQPSGISYRIEVLIATHCRLNDKDAGALASILKHKFTRRFECHLRTLDLGNNDITNSGAQALSAALKYNRLVTRLDLSENHGVSDQRIIDTIGKRVRRNHDGKSNLPWYQKPRRWFR